MEEKDNNELRKKLSSFIWIPSIMAIKLSLLLFSPLDFIKEGYSAYVRRSIIAAIGLAIFLIRLLWIGDAKSKTVVILLSLVIALRLLLIGVGGQEQSAIGIVAVGICWIIFLGWFGFLRIDRLLNEEPVSEDGK